MSIIQQQSPKRTPPFIGTTSKVPMQPIVFWAELVRARKLVSDQPQVWTPYLHHTRCFQLDKFPYGLVYVERSDKIIGLAVCHLQRQPSYWRNRLTD